VYYAAYNINSRISIAQLLCISGDRRPLNKILINDFLSLPQIQRKALFYNELFGPKPFVLSNFCGKIFKVMLNWVKKWGLKFL